MAVLEYSGNAQSALMAPEFEDDLPELAEVGFAALATLGSDGCPWLADLSVPVVTEYALSEFVVAVPDFEDDSPELVALAGYFEGEPTARSVPFGPPDCDLLLLTVPAYFGDELPVVAAHFEDDFAALVVLTHVHELHLFADFVCVEYFQFLFLHFSWSENSEDDRLR